MEHTEVQYSPFYASVTPPTTYGLAYLFLAADTQFFELDLSKKVAIAAMYSGFNTCISRGVAN